MEVDPAELIKAEEYYLQSLNAGDQPASAYVPVKAFYGLGQVHLAGSRFDSANPHWSKEEARRFLQQVIDTYDDLGQPTDLIWFAGDAYGLLCRLNSYDQNWLAMSSECNQAIEILSVISQDSARKWVTLARYGMMVAYAEKEQGQLKAARDAYCQAIQVGRGYISPEEQAKWRDALEWAEEDPCHV
jgi:hypothetical protein